jgi:cyclophilin family peptidyl-prolyl cis-trans isomerase
MQTTLGTIVIELNAEKAPKTDKTDEKKEIAVDEKEI